MQIYANLCICMEMYANLYNRFMQICQVVAARVDLIASTGLSKPLQRKFSTDFEKAI